MADDEREMQVNDGANGDRVVKVNYPSNSNRARSNKSEKADKSDPPKKKVEQVTKGEVVERKKGLGRKIAETFTGDNMANVGLFILNEVVIPQVKTLISDAISQGTERTLFGESRRSGSSNRYSGTRTSYTAYNRYSGSPTGRAGESDGPKTSTFRGGSSNLNEIVLETRGDAEQVLELMGSLISQYDVATVSDLKDSVGKSGTFTDEKWGWYETRGMRIQRVRDGFLLDLPNPQPID